MNRKKILSLLTAGLMIGSMMIPSAAAADIKITNGNEGAQYKAYQLLKLTTSLKPDHVAHEGAHDLDDCYNYAYTVNPTYRDILKAAIGNTEATDEQIINAIQAMGETEIRDFADTVFAAVKNNDGEATATNGTFTFEDVDQGYYLITETTTVDGENKDISLVMLNTAGKEDIEMAAKRGVPELTKKIKVGNDLKDADAVAAADTVVYQLRGTMPAEIAAYDTYKMIFHDKIGVGLTVKPETVTVTVGGAALAADKFIVRSGDQITSGDGCGLEVEITDVKTVATVDKNTVVLVEYECSVDDVAGGLVLGKAGNPNTASLEFSNNPYVEDATGETPEDVVSVFSFALHVNKVTNIKNGDETVQQPLAGAGFTLYRADANADGGWKLIKEIAAGETTEFVFDGLDEGDYKLVETTVPAGYAKADDVTFSIVPTMEGNALTALAHGEVSGIEGELAVDADAGTFTGAVLNVAGFRLPITGGAGTFAIYAGGAALLAVGGLAVAAKKRKTTDAE